jgi:RNA polymerase sigma-70 factor (ECF subfamily)
MKQQAITSAFTGIISQIGRKSATREARFCEPDEAILQAIRDGDYEAFGELTRRYENFVYSLVSGIVRTPETARDLTQEVFLRAYKSIRRFEQRSSFKTWLYRIAYNTSMAHLSREKRSAEREAESITEQVDNSYKNSNIRIYLEKIIGMLKPEYRAVILLYYYDDLKYEEIAETLNCPVGTVKIRLYRAKYELKQLWSKYAIQL